MCIYKYHIKIIHFFIKKSITHTIIRGFCAVRHAYKILTFFKKRGITNSPTSSPKNPIIFNEIKSEI